MALLGLDIGTSGTKALLIDENGRVLASATAPHTVQRPAPGHSEQDAEKWYTAVGRATRAAMNEAELGKNDVQAIGLSGQMHGAVLLGDKKPNARGANLVPLRPAMLWNDQRAVPQCGDLQDSAGGRKKLIAKTGSPALPGFQAPKALWVREHEPEVWERTKKLLLPKDYVRYRLTGELVTEPSDASGTGLYNVAKRRWHKKLISKLGLPSDLLPPCADASHTPTGGLSAGAARSLGIAAGTPVVGGAGDQAAGAIGMGIVQAGMASATLGTSGVVFAHADRFEADPGGRVHTMCHAVEGAWCVFGCMLAAAGSLAWWKDAIAADTAMEALLQEAEAASPADGLYFLPYLTGERCPYADPAARGCFIGLDPDHGRGAMTLALLEGVSYGMAAQVKLLREALGLPVDLLRMAGGGSRSPFWRQTLADASAAPAVLTNAAADAPAYGVALLAGMGVGVWSSAAEATAGIVENSRIEPDAAAVTRHAARLDQHGRLYEALRPEFPRLGTGAGHGPC